MGIWCGRFNIRPGEQAFILNLDRIQVHSQIFVPNFGENIDKNV